MSDEIDIQTAALLSPDSKRKNFNNMPPEAQQTDLSETRQPPSVDGNHDTEKEQAASANEVSSESNNDQQQLQDDDEKKDEAEASNLFVTRVTADPDGTDSCHEDNGTGLDGESRMPSGSPKEILISSNSQDDDEDNNSVEELLRDCQSVSTITSCKTKEPEGRLSRVPSDTCLSNILDMNEPTTSSSKDDGYPTQCEPSPIRAIETTTNPKVIFDRGTSTVSDPISPVSFLESAAVDAVSQKQLEPTQTLVPKPEPVEQPAEETAQLLLQLQQQGTSPPPPPPPPSDHAPPGNNEFSTITEHQTMMEPVMETDESHRLSVSSGRQILSPTEQQHPLSSQHPPLPIIPTLPHLLPAPRGNLTHAGAPTPSPAGNGYHHHHPQAMYIQHHPHTAPAGAPLPSSVVMPSNGGKRKIHLRLVEDVNTQTSLDKTLRKTGSSFLSFRRKKVHQRSISENLVPTDTDRGRVTVSWYEGTTSLELQEHVRNTVIRKLGLSGTTKLVDMRILDESCDPPEEIVLSTFIPNGSRLLLRFATRDAGGDVTPPPGRRPSYTGGAPDSPSAAPSPYPSSLDLNGLGLNPNQLALLGARLEASKVDPKARSLTANGGKSEKTTTIVDSKSPKDTKGLPNSKFATKVSPTKSGRKTPTAASPERGVKREKDDDDDSESSTMEMNSLHPEDQIQKSLRQITELLIAERTSKKYSVPSQEKRKVVFVLANYFVLFLSLIAISAEIQARAPDWNASVEQYLKNVRTCSQDQDALFECVSNGDLAGLMASVVLWFSRSAATKRIFLFGFESPKKLWTVVYESLVTSICWGFSYMFIRRGMNPDTSRNFLQKYWKDAIYGSLAGFNAAFLKHVLKNLIPQEAIEDALQDRQLKILSWLPSFS